MVYVRKAETIVLYTLLCFRNDSRHVQLIIKVLHGHFDDFLVRLLIL